MKVIFVLLLLPLLIFSQTTPDFSETNLKKHLLFLSGDSLKGRFPGTPEDKVAADYIAGELLNAGLMRLNNVQLQSFKVITGFETGQNNKLSFDGIDFIPEKDFSPVSFSSDTSLTAEVVFAGYGFDISEEKFTWNDYQNIDCEGKWVLILRSDPENDNPDSKFINYAKLRSKVITAVDHKAAGVLFVTGKRVEKDDQLPPQSFDKIAADAGIPVISITRKTADQILIRYNDTMMIDNLENRICKSKMPFSFETDQILNGSAEIKINESETYNIMAYIPGYNLMYSDQYIVVGAHYDHLGMGGQGSGSREPDVKAIHHGADDNASGVAGIIELARAFSKISTDRSIIFVAFGAEEMGLLGSKHFVENLPVPKEKIVAMLNFDMIGRFEEKISVGGTGTALQFDSLLNMVSEKSKIEIVRSAEGYGPSDHASFYSENIPVLYFNSGIHGDYHTPADSEEKINYKGMKEILGVSFELLNQIQKGQNSLSFREAGSKTKSSRNNLKVTFGIIPDFATKVKGMGVGGVNKGGPADHAGIVKGDVIVAINGEKVEDIYEYMQRLSKLKPGQTAVVEIVRNNDKKILLIQL
ncbi:MAG: hypothetical protein A2W91_05190 [Bacteroidetes bacterium GWF2_38_335]|nr:MAG: hypothetical protein A2W91_05190 [Bacteroidetes bacterium GWF2_38_335]OFY79775.1 MAG: hypothetical protein A2281_10230 [Bacteroidetes bacterium RIFOXYA12_FULL_38_20]HBS88163.1 hypothetical protein [Bacteroidales bacterium]